MKPGDVYVTNDPWLGTGHLNDVCVVKPVFLKNRLVAFASTTAHVPDIGGRIRSEVLPFRLDLARPSLSSADELTLGALEKQAAAVAVKSLISLAAVNDIDHLGRGIPQQIPVPRTLTQPRPNLRRFSSRERQQRAQSLWNTQLRKLYGSAAVKSHSALMHCEPE